MASLGHFKGHVIDEKAFWIKNIAVNLQLHEREFSLMRGIQVGIGCTWAFLAFWPEIIGLFVLPEIKQSMILSD
tara:strand:+ start:141 stop:362 length:222 start_codon:yes stop_codon:yes gene_type:complete